MNTPNDRQSNFLKELQELCDKYLYILSPTLKYTEVGIIPQLSLLDKPPVKETTKVEPVTQTTKTTEK